MADEKKQQLLNWISEVKARLDGKVDSLNFPIPQFIVVGKQSVGKSRLIEALAGEPFNFVSGTLGSRRPTVLEFRNVPGLKPSKWSIRAEDGVWRDHPISEVVEIVGRAHESLGNNVTDVPIRVKVQGEDCVDLGLVDLPGFRSYAKDAAMQDLAQKIEKLVSKFMNDENNVMLVVEEAGDAAGFATLAKARELDPSYRRTILVRNKLDKYYNDLTNENINKWLEGFGDLSPTLKRFALSLPHWTTGEAPKPFGELRKECSNRDVMTLIGVGASEKYKHTIGFEAFRLFMEDKVQRLFAEALSPMLTRLKSLKADGDQRLDIIQTEMETINEDGILHATRSAGISFAQSFNFLMEGALSSQTNRKTMEEELKAFYQHCDRTECLSVEERLPTCYTSMDEYVNYLRDTVRLQGMDVELNGGAQFRRLMYEVEVFTRFAGLGDKLEERDIILARGSGARGTTPWEDAITRLMLKTAPKHIASKTKYVGERLKWFFTEQKDATVEFMLQMKGSPEEHMFSRLLNKQAKVMERNDTMKACIFKAYDHACATHQDEFMKLWNDFMGSMFQSPLMLLKSSSMVRITDETTYTEEVAPTFESTKDRIMNERKQRGAISTAIRSKMKDIPEDDFVADTCTTLVQDIIEQTFSAIRCVVADQMQLYSESFFLLPMLRRLEGAMANLELEEEDRQRYQVRMTVLQEEKAISEGINAELNWSLEAIEKFKVTCLE
jgi:GTP-binding protein EngB required for normal cell division